MEIKNIYIPINLGDRSNNFTEALNENFNTTAEDVQYLYDNLGKVTEPATSESLGGIKASPKTENETVEVKIGDDSKLYVPLTGLTEVPLATDTVIGGIKALPKTAKETVEIKIGTDGKLYGEAGGIEEIPLATATLVGGIKASPKTENEFSEIKMGVDGKLYAAVGSLPAPAGIALVSIDESDWIDDTLEIPNSIHTRGATPALIVATQAEVSPGVYKVSNDSPTVSNVGTVTIKTRKPWKGMVLIAGGISGGGSIDLTEVWNAINSILDTLNTLEITIEEI